MIYYFSLTIQTEVLCEYRISEMFQYEIKVRMADCPKLAGIFVHPLIIIAIFDTRML